MNPKTAIAKKIAGMLNDDQKRKTIQAFYDKNKDSPELEENLKSLKKMLNYDKDDVPER